MSKKWRKKSKPVLTTVQKLRKIMFSEETSEQNKILCKSLIDWKIINHKWNDVQIIKIEELISNKKEYFLYGISDGEQVKLGMSRQIKTRIKELQTGNPRVLGEIWSEPAGFDRNIALRRESDLHKRCMRYRRTGEWFSLECMRLVVTFNMNI